MSRAFALVAIVWTVLFRICVAVPAQIKQPSLSRSFHTFGLKRSTSQDPSCPSGYLCDQDPCPANVICAEGDACVNFEGTFACIPAGAMFCALNPTTFEAVGCNQGVCCHGNCYIEGTVCCDDASVQCSIGQLCNACPSGQTCGTNGCSGGTVSASKTTSTASSSTQTPNPTIVPSSGTFQVLGCYEDSVDDRVLTDGSSIDYSSTGMTIEKCTALANGYQFAGVEYSGECYWGNSVSYNTSENIGDCNMACDGNPAEFCGGGNRILIYQNVE